MQWRLPNTRPALGLVGPLIGILLLTGCQSDGRVPAQVGAVSSVNETRQQFAKGAAQVDEMIAATQAMSEVPTDLSKEFAQFNKELAETQKMAANAAARTADMRGRAAAYVERWQADMQQVSNPELRSAATRRAAAVKARYDDIKAAATSTREAYQPFVNELTDLQAYLSHDLTAEGVRAARPIFDEAIGRGQTLRQALDALNKEFAAVAREMAPTAATTPQ